MHDGKWKLLSTDSGKWELYDIENDRTELHSLDDETELTADLINKYNQWAERCGVLEYPIKSK